MHYVDFICGKFSLCEQSKCIRSEEKVNKTLFVPQTTGYYRVCQLFAEVWRLNSWTIVAILRKRKRCTLKVPLLCLFSAWNGTLFLIFIQQNDLFRGKLQSLNWWKIWYLPQAGQTITSTVIEIILRNCFVLFMSNGLLKKLARMCLNVGFPTCLQRCYSKDSGQNWNGGKWWSGKLL